MKRLRIGISACLYGENVRFDGGNKKNEEILSLVQNHEVFLLCPEVSGGLPVPRNPSERKGERVINDLNEDVTEYYLKGTENCMRTIREKRIDLVILKAKSPACGKDNIYDGTFSHSFTHRHGTLTEACLKNAVLVFTEEEIDKIKEALKSYE